MITLLTRTKHISSSVAKVGTLSKSNTNISAPASVSPLEGDWIQITYKAYNLHNK